jgi:DNA polymerase-3 subunit chi
MDDSGSDRSAVNAPRVDFYVLGGQAPEAIQLLTCKVTEKAYLLGNQVYIHTPDVEASDAVDARLWTFRAGSFVPHCVQGAEALGDEPVRIGSSAPPPKMRDVLVNLTDSVPDFFTEFSRVVEILGSSDEQRSRGRIRYAAYRANGCEINTHRLDTGNR